MKTISNILLLTLILLSVSQTSAGLFEEEGVEITEATNLALDAGQRLPILLLVSREHCPFCVQIKRDILGPMIKGEDYKGRLLIRELYIDLGTSVIDFSGAKISSADFAHKLGVSLTPTLLFLGTNGEELAERLVGISTPEMFFFYVDEAVKQAIGHFQRQ